jgi:hypothetical protein
MRGLGVCHPMYLVRLRTFLEWQQREGSPVEVLLPTDPAISTHLAEMGVFQGVDVDLVGTPARVGAATSRILPLTSVADPSGVETLADSAVAALESCPSAVKRLASPLHMAIAELGDNAVSHGRNGLGIRVACSLDDSRPEIRLAVGDLGMGIPEHIRQTHPDWGDDTAAIANAVAPGVSGTRDPHRGNGFLHILDEALTAELGAARLEIYSANGFLRLDAAPCPDLQTRRVDLLLAHLRRIVSGRCKPSVTGRTISNGSKRRIDLGVTKGESRCTSSNSALSGGPSRLAAEEPSCVSGSLPTRRALTWRWTSRGSRTSAPRLPTSSLGGSSRTTRTST